MVAIFEKCAIHPIKRNTSFCRLSLFFYCVFVIELYCSLFLCCITMSSSEFSIVYITFPNEVEAKKLAK